MPQKTESACPSSAHGVQDSGAIMSAWNSLLYTLGGAPTTEGELLGSEQSFSADPLPVTVLSGFLGAGKTTLLCDLLAETDLDVLAIVNDIAAVNVDAALVKTRTAETIQLENGCACCVLGNDLELVLNEVGSRSSRPDAIIIEASGISDPMGIAQTVANSSATTLDGVLALVDTQTIAARLADPASASLFRRQLEAAHLVLLTKAADERDIEVAQETIAELAPGRAVLSAGALKGNLAELVLGASQRGARPEPAAQHHAYRQFENTVIDLAEPLSADRFFSLMDQIPEAVYRIKGWLTLTQAEGNVRCDFQAVGPRWRIRELGSADNIEAPDQLVIIGHKASPQLHKFSKSLREATLGSE